MPLALIVGKEDEDLKFGKVTAIYVDSKSVYFEFIPMITKQYHHHFHAYALTMPTDMTSFLVKHSCLLDFHPHGLYHSVSVSSNSRIQYVVTRSNIY